jgi:hypothetical protein
MKTCSEDLSLSPREIAGHVLLGPHIGEERGARQKTFVKR